MLASVGAIPEGRVLHAYAIEVDDQDFRHIRTSVDGRRGWVSIRSTRNQLCLEAYEAPE